MTAVIRRASRPPKPVEEVVEERVNRPREGWEPSRWLRAEGEVTGIFKAFGCVVIRESKRAEERRWGAK